MKLLYSAPILTALILAACGPGVVDGAESIGYGYYLADTGGNGRTIEFHENGKKPRAVIGARVETFAKRGQTIVVARRPASVVMKNGSAEWNVSEACEYWLIDTKSHTVEITTDEREYRDVNCHS
jgi:hypothetical protein